MHRYEWNQSDLLTATYIAFYMCTHTCTHTHIQSFTTMHRYEWNQSDLLTATANLRMYLDEQMNVPYETLQYVIGDVNYGGRVTDYMDQRCVAAILQTYIINGAVENDEYRYTDDGKYYPPPPSNMQSVRDYIDQLPLIDSPEIFGLHRNAAIAFENSETRYLMETIISVQPRYAHTLTVCMCL